MGKLEKFGRSILKKLGSSRSSSRRRREEATSTSSDEETTVRDQTRGIHRIQLVPPEDPPGPPEGSEEEDVKRIGSPAGSEEGSAGYATDDTALSSLGPLDIKRVSVDYSESQGYYSNAELSPIPRIEVTVPPADLSSPTISPAVSPRSGTVSQQSPRGHTAPTHLKKYEDPTVPIHRSYGQPADLRQPTVPPPTHQTVPKILGVTVPPADLSRVCQGEGLLGTVPAEMRLQDPTQPVHRVTVPAHQTPTVSIPRILGVTVPLASPQATGPPLLTFQSPEDTVPAHLTPREPLFAKKQNKLTQEYPRIDVRSRMNRKNEPIYKSSQLLNTENLENSKIERSATLSNLTAPEEEDPIDRFMKSHIYKTKMITTVFEAKDRGFEEISLDVIHEIDRWFESKNMMAVACELHWSVPSDKRSRQLECKLKEKLLQALRENNKRLLYLRGMGHGKTPVKLAESNTVENISRDRETDSVRGIYQRSYTRLLPYLHKETPEWHSQYWTLQDLPGTNSDDSTLQPEPQKFLFESEPSDVLLLITATNSEDETVSSSTILKINVVNLDDNEPKFLESSLPLFHLLKNTSKPTAIGRLTAQDPDLNPIFYHILPNCGSTEISKNFSIDSEFGEIIYHPKGATVPDQVELCFIATSQKDLDTSDVFFDGNKGNFKKILVNFMENMDGKKEISDGKVDGNMSISQVGEVLDRIEIPLFLNSGVGDFELKNLQFVPANYELGRDMISPEGAVELNKRTGEIVANGKILDTPQGVYTAEIGKEGQGNMAVKQLHHIRNDRKLRYVLSMSRNEFGANLEKFKRQILEAIGKDDQKAGKQLEIHFDEPKMDRKNSTWTSVCFYLTRENAILDDKQTSALISPANGHISKLHHIFKVQNVDNCSPRSSTATESSSSSGSSDIPLNTLILIGVVGLLVILLIALLVFVCCVSRYQRYLKQKTDRMRCNSSTGSYYKSPNLIPPPPPGYMHTPPLPPPPPPQAIAYY